MSANTSAGMIDAAMNLGDAIIDGMLKAIGAGAGRVKDKVVGIAKDAVGGVKDFLGIGSPSKVFMEIGENMIAGMAVGLSDKGNAVSKSIEGVASDVVDTASNMLSKVPDMLGDLTDIDPVITPVLDLSKVEKDAKKLGDLTNVTPITAAPSFQQAAAISEEQETAQIAQAASAAVTQFNFEQNNYSPESLSYIEIYRQTSNQLAQAKSALGLAPS